MVERLSASQVQARSELPDWRVLLNRIEAQFRTGSFDAAASFVQEIVDAAEAANHHPDLDVRYPDRVHVSLTTHSAHGLTEADVALASTISELALRGGAAADPLAPTRLEVAIDAMDIDAVRPFWRAVLGYVDDPPAVEGGPIDAIVDPLGRGPAFWFQQMDAPRPQRNRIHIDVTVAHDAAEDRIAAAIAAGGTLVTDEHARSFWVLADPEGNEACVCTWQDRDSS